MSKVLIDRELAERVCHVDNSTRQTARRELRTILATPSGTPAMPVKAYYHEWTDLEGVRTRSVGLEVRKEFTDAPLVLEADALAQIAFLEGEIAKRDARIVELENELSDIDFARRVSLQNESDLAETLNLLRAGLAAAPAAPAADAPPENCRQRLAADGKPYPKSSCAACGQFSPKWRECDEALAAHRAKGVV